MATSIIARILVRKPSADAALLDELVQTTQDRISLRYMLPESDPWPERLDSVIVEIVTALYNRHEVNHEGVQSETVDAFSISFVDDIIGKYDADIRGYIAQLDEEGLSRLNVVRFI